MSESAEAKVGEEVETVLMGYCDIIGGRKVQSIANSQFSPVSLEWSQYSIRTECEYRAQNHTTLFFVYTDDSGCILVPNAQSSVGLRDQWRPFF